MLDVQFQVIMWKQLTHSSSPLSDMLFTSPRVSSICYFSLYCHLVQWYLFIKDEGCCYIDYFCYDTKFYISSLLNEQATYTSMCTHTEWQMGIRA